MAINRLAHSPCGELVILDGGNRAYVPNKLPRGLDLDQSLILRLDDATRAVATLAGVGETIPNPHLLIRPFIRREAVLSSRIEGTQASLSDLFQFEASSTETPRGDLLEVINYVKAFEHGLALLDEIPISVRLINQMHDVLLRGVRGSGHRIGELRTEQVWIGSADTPIEDAKYIPPPASELSDLLLDWEKFVNFDSKLPPLIQCALMHYQFEAIHPYFDGNGRIGRLLIILFLCANNILPQPLLYLSAYFERNREAYYQELFNVSETGDWDSWLAFFLDGVADQANDAIRRIRRVRFLQEEMRTLLQENHESGNAFFLLEHLFESPVMTVPRAVKLLGITSAGARRVLDRFAALGIVEFRPETWPRQYVAKKLFDAIDAPIAED